MRYDEIVDRIRMDGINLEGDTTTLWFTRRLADLVVSHFLQTKNFDHDIDEKSSGGGASTGNEIVGPEEATTPVIPKVGGQSILIGQIDLSTQGDDVTMTFKGTSADEQACLSLSNAALGTWLGGIEQCYRLGKWDVSIWDAAQGQAVDAPPPRQSMTLH